MSVHPGVHKFIIEVQMALVIELDSIYVVQRVFFSFFLFSPSTPIGSATADGGDRRRECVHH